MDFWEIFIDGVKKFGGEIVAAVLLGIFLSIPSVRKIFRKLKNPDKNEVDVQHIEELLKSEIQKQFETQKQRTQNLSKEEKERIKTEAQKQAEKKLQAEIQHQREIQKQEEEKLKAEAQRHAEELKRIEEERKKLEEIKKQEEARKQAEIEKQREAQRHAEEVRRQLEEVQRKAQEAQKKFEEIQRQADIKKQEEARKLAEETRKKLENVQKQAEEVKKQLKTTTQEEGPTDAEAQCELGDCYECGKGVEEDYEKAVYWYRKAAEQGNFLAQYELRSLGESWKKGPADDDDEWPYMGEEDPTDAEDQYRLGLEYYNGIGEIDYKKAVDWFSKAAEQGHSEAQLYLGDCYKLGHGVAKDKKKAVYWYRKAAEQGNTDAKDELRSLGESW